MRIWPAAELANNTPTSGRVYPELPFGVSSYWTLLTLGTACGAIIFWHTLANSAVPPLRSMLLLGLLTVCAFAGAKLWSIIERGGPLGAVVELLRIQSDSPNLSAPTATSTGTKTADHGVG